VSEYRSAAAAESHNGASSCPSWLDPEAAQLPKDETSEKAEGFSPSAIAPPGLEPNAEPKKRLPLLREPLPLLGSNQDSPDPE
jgi:hypothetical protein